MASGLTLPSEWRAASCNWSYDPKTQRSKLNEIDQMFVGGPVCSTILSNQWHDE